MSNNLFFDGREYISAGDTASLHDFSRDYIGRLCREQKVVARRVGNQWFVDAKCLQDFVYEQQRRNQERYEALSKERKQSYGVVAPVPAEPAPATVVEETVIEEAAQPVIVPVTPEPDEVVMVVEEVGQVVEEVPVSASGVAVVEAPVPEMQPSPIHMHTMQAHMAKVLATAVHPLSTDAVRQAAVHGVAHAPVLSPLFDFAHKALSLFLAFMLTFGTYAMVDAEYARTLITSSKQFAATVAQVPSRMVATGEAFASVARTNNESVAQVAAAASGGALDTLALRIHAFVDSMVSRAVFSGLPSFALTLPQRNSAGGVVRVALIPFTPTPSVKQEGTAAATQYIQQTILEQPIRERIVERVVAGESLSLAEMRKLLNQLDNKLTSQIKNVSASVPPVFSSYGGTVAQSYPSTFGLSQRIDSLTNISISGGTITNASISGGSLSGVMIGVGNLEGVVAIANGGTGTSTTPSYGAVLVGDGAGGYQLLATSSLGIAGGVGLPGGSDAQLQYNNGGVLAGATVYFDDVTGRFGIGTSSPYAALSVVGEAVARNFTATSSATSTLPNLAVSNVSVGGRLYDGAGTAGANGYVLQTTGSGVQWVATSSLGIVGGGSGATFGQAFELVNGVLTPTTTVGVIVAASSTFSGGISATNATTGNSTSTNAYASSLVAGNSTATNQYASNLVAGNATTSNLYIGSLTGVLRAAAGKVSTGLVSLATEISGVLGISNGGTGTSTAPTYGQVLLGNIFGGYDLVSTSSLGIAGSGASVWGAITGTLANQTDLQNALNAKLTASEFFATTTDGVDEGLSNLYFTQSRATSNFAQNLAATTTTALAEGNNLYFTTPRATSNFVTNLAATTSVASITTLSNLSITNSQVSDFSTGVNSFVAASTTIPKTYTNNTFTGSNTFQAATSTSFAITSIANALLKTLPGGSVVAAVAGTDYVASVTGDWTGTFDGQEGSYYLNAGNLTNFGTPFFNFFAATTTDALAQGSTNRYYADSLVNTFIGASSTVPKTYTNNTFTNANTFNGQTTLGSASSTNLTVSNLASTSNLVASNSFTFSNVTGFLKATAGVVATSLINLASDVTGILAVSNGGTGWGNIQSNSVVLGNGTGAVATTSAGTNGQVLALVNGVPTWTATTTLSTIEGTLAASKGGTGQGSYSVGDILYASDPNTLTRLGVGSAGTVLKVAGGVPTWGTDITTGGGGGAGAWSTTTDSLGIYPADTSDVIIIGSSATATLASIFEVSGKSYFSNFLGIATTSAGSLLSIGGVGNFAPTGSTLYSGLTLGSLSATSSTLLASTTLSGNTLVGNATSTNLALTNVLSTILKTNSSGSIVPAVLGTDYISSAVTAIGPTGQTQTGPTVTLATSTTGTDFTVTAAGNTITYNLPTASAANRGLLNTTDFANFIAKLSSTSLDTSLELATLIGDETGSGSLVFSAAPTFTGTANFANTANTGTLSATGLASFVNASSTLFSAGRAYFGQTATTTIDGAGNVAVAGTLGVTGNTTLANATSTNLAITAITNALLSVNAGGSVIATTISSPLTYSSNALGIQNAAADGATKGAASFTTADFDASSGNIAIDYTNGQAASAGAKGFLTSADFTIFTNKLSTTSIDTLAELETITGVTNILVENDIDASTELAAIMDDETGSGALVFGTSPTLSGATLNGNTTLANATSTTLALTNVLSTILKTNGSGSVIPAVAGVDYQAAGTYLTALGNGYSSTTGTTVTFSTSTTAFNGLTTGLTVSASNGALTLTPSLTGTLNNAGLTNSTVSFGGVSLALGGTDATPAFNLTDATSLPISTGVSGLGANVATFLGTPSSANLATALTDETGSGAAVFGTTPTLSTLTISSGGINVTNSGITNAGAISGATTITASGLGSFGTLTAAGATSTALFGGTLSANTARFGQTATTTIDGAGNVAVAGTLGVTGQTTLATSLTGLLKATAGVVSTATAGTDYLTSTFKDWSVFGGNSYMAPTTTLGVIVSASSTIGSGTQTGGLTISGGATTTGNAYFAGNVGIGTTSPVAPLTVAGYVGSGNTILQAGTDGSFTTFDGELGLLSNAYVTSGVVKLINTARSSWYTTARSNPSNDDYIISRAPAGSGSYVTHFVVDANGDVGIASTSPYAKLSVENTGTAPSFFVGDEAYPDTTPFIIDATGAVGIGTSSPGSKLSIQGNVFLAGNIVATSTATSTLAGGVQANALDITSTSATSTFANGLNLTGGCYAINGVCVGAGSGIATLGPTGQGQTGATQTFATSTDTNIGLTITASGNTHTFTSTFTGTLADARVADAITISGGTIGTNSISGTLTTTGTLNIGDGGDRVDVASSGWDVTNSVITGATWQGAAIGAAYLDPIVITTDVLNTSASLASLISDETGTAGFVVFSASPTFTGRALFANASSTMLSSRTAYFGGTATTTIDAAGSLSVAGTLGVTGNTTLANATSTNLALTNVLSTILKTDGSGSIIPAIAGTDYVASAITTLGPTGQGQTGATQLLATSTSAFNGLTSALTIVSSGNTHTFTPSMSGTLTVGGGGTGATSLTGLLQGNGSGAITAVTGTAGQFPYFNGANTLAATSTIFLATNGNVGVSTTSPWAKLSVTNASNSFPSFVVEDSASPDQTPFLIDSSGNVGIGTSSPLYSLDLSTSAGGGIRVSNVSTTIGPIVNLRSFGSGGRSWNLGSGQSTDAAGTGKFFIFDETAGQNRIALDSTGLFGIGTTTPFRKLSLTDAVSTAQTAIAYDSTRYTDLLTDASGDFVINPSGNDAYFNDDNLWVCSGGSCPTGAPSGNGNLIVESRIGIGTSTPNFALSVAGVAQVGSTPTGAGVRAQTNGSLGEIIGINHANNAYNGLQFTTGATPTLSITTGGSVGVGTTTPVQQLSVANNLYIGNGGVTAMGQATSTFQGDIKILGKLDVGTIDPVYTIGGVKYATYGASTVGIKEEATAKFALKEYDAKRKLYKRTVAFSELEKGSDLWLFYQVTTFGEDWEKLVVNLTPAFDGRVFYEEDVEAKTITIYGSEKGSVSARFIADRYDADKWSNVRPDQDDPFTHHRVEEKK